MFKRVLKSLILAGLGLVLLAAPASAQLKWNIGLGATMPQGDFGDSFKMGFNAMGAATLTLPAAPIGIRADATYNVNKCDITGCGNISSNLLTVSGDAVFSFPGVGAKPYILGGITWARASLGGSDAPAGIDAQSDIGFNVGAGLNFALGGMGVFAEARYFTISGDVDADFIPITVGVRF